ncbi:MAG: type III-A CRISPR-associated protein Cas10/Csm1 [Candidatus Pacearchaeota archaeon]
MLREQGRTHENLNNFILGGPAERKVSLSYLSRQSRTIQRICVELGDWISAQERNDLDDEDTLEKINVRTIPLERVFSKIKLSEQETKKSWHVHKNLTFKLPTQEDYLKKIEKEKIFRISLYENFVKEIRDLLGKYDIEKEEERASLFRELLDLLKKYLSYVPSASFYSEPDIDLYNHLKMSCAVTSCLYYLYLEEKDEKPLKKLREELYERFTSENNTSREEEIELTKNKYEEYDRKRFLLLKGDLSGIQKFVSMISSERAIRLLKGRSFYLSFLNRTLALKLCKLLDLPETNIIFSEGGNFEILAPNLEKVKRQIENFSEEINDFLWEKFGTTLFLNVKYFELSARDFSREFFHKIFYQEEDLLKEKRLIELTKKNKKFYKQLKEVINEEGDQNFEIKSTKCKVCSKDSNEEELKEGFCKNCNEFKELISKIKEWQEKKKITRVDKEIFLIKNESLFNFLEYNLKEKSFLPSLNLEGIYEIIPIGLPLKEGNIIEFEEIAKKAKERTGTEKIAALKIDMDNLGEIFKRGLGKNLTLSLYSRLSFDISLFFSGIIEELRNKKEYKEEIYIIYSGGDDSFIIGSWDRVLEFAKDLYFYFKVYTGDNPDITLSASYNIFSPKYPVKKIFEKAEIELEKAKCFDEKKSRISIFGNPLKWEGIEEFNKIEEINKEDINEILNKDDFEIVLKISEYLKELIEKKEISRRFLFLADYYAKEILDKLEEDKRDILPIYRMRYYIERNIKEENIKNSLINLWETSCYSTMDDSFKKNKNVKKLELLRISSKIAQLKTKQRE